MTTVQTGRAAEHKVCLRTTTGYQLDTHSLERMLKYAQIRAHGKTLTGDFTTVKLRE